MYVSRVCLKHIRGISNLELNFSIDCEPQASTLLIGRNGTGKSSILRSIVLGLASETDATALLAEKFGSPFISKGQDKGTIELDYVDNCGKTHSVAREIVRDGPNTEKATNLVASDLTQPLPLVVALGAGRSNEGASSVSTYGIVHSTYMLFDYDGTFFDPELTLRRLKDYLEDAKYQRILGNIEAALGLQSGDSLQLPRGGGVVVSDPDRANSIPLHSWADGYRITLNWLLDVYAWAMMCEGSIDEQGHIQGVLLIDEIEQHLHPMMQRTIIQSTKKQFPKMQIVASTHSPLVVQGAESYEIVSLYRCESRITAKLLRDYSRLSIEDLFTAEELFNTPPNSIEAEKSKERYRSLIAKGELSSAEQEQLRDLGRTLADLRMISPPREELTFDQLIDRISELSDDSC